MLVARTHGCQAKGRQPRARRGHRQGYSGGRGMVDEADGGRSDTHNFEVA